MLRFIFIVLFFLLFLDLGAQQTVDTTYYPEIRYPSYSPGEGPVIAIDSGHHNFHTKSGRYKPFAELLERDGYKVTSYKGSFNEKDLSRSKILVISNAQHVSNVRRWYIPVHSAFLPKEIDVLKKWVSEGGSLFLIADHMPMAGAAYDLASVFGFTFTDGFAIDTSRNGPAVFSRPNASLHSSIVTNGLSEEESIEQVATFTGQAFDIPENATPILLFDKNYINILPDTAWVFTDNSIRKKAEGLCQGAYQSFGKGKIVVFGEAAMFSAQVVPQYNYKAGMNNDLAKDNYKLLLNIVHWLDGQFD